MTKLEAAGAVLLGQDQLRRVCHGLVERELGVRAGAQPGGYGAGSGRIERRLGGGGGGQHGGGHAGYDTGGSIRQPASFCGVVGVLPTYGRVSRYGLIAFASSLDRVGPFAANVRDAATMLGVIAGHDPKDATSSPAPVPDYAAESDKPCEGLRIGVPAEYFAEGLDPEVRAAIEKGIAALKTAGCSVKPVSLPHTKYAVPTYYLIATAEASANLARFDGVRYGYRSPASGRFPPCTATLATRASGPRSSGAFCWGRMRFRPATTMPII